MRRISVPKISVTVVALSLAVCCGCHSGPWGKREQELSCPTDVRKSLHWCWGEDAIFDCPCGPDEAYHGYKPTCWHDWQAPATVWRDERCGGPCMNSQPVGMQIISERTVSPGMSPTPAGPAMNGRPVAPLRDGEEVVPLPSLDDSDAGDLDEPEFPELSWKMEPIANSSVAKNIPLIGSPTYEHKRVVYEQQSEVQEQPKRLPTANNFGFTIIR